MPLNDLNYGCINSVIVQLLYTDHSKGLYTLCQKIKTLFKAVIYYLFYC